MWGVRGIHHHRHVVAAGAKRRLPEGGLPAVEVGSPGGAHILPTICPQLRLSPVIPRDVLRMRASARSLSFSLRRVARRVWDSTDIPVARAPGAACRRGSTGSRSNAPDPLGHPGPAKMRLSPVTTRRSAGVGNAGLGGVKWGGPPGGRKMRSNQAVRRPLVSRHMTPTTKVTLGCDRSRAKA